MAANGSVPLKKIKPKPGCLKGFFPYYCETCLTEWMQRKMEPSIICPSCGKSIVLRKDRPEKYANSRESAAEGPSAQLGDPQED